MDIKLILLYFFFYGIHEDLKVASGWVLLVSGLSFIGSRFHPSKLEGTYQDVKFLNLVHFPQL